MKLDYKKIGEFISTLRKEKNMTQEDLSKKMIVDRGTVSKWERGVYVPNPEDLLSLSKILNISVNEILIGERKSKNNEVELNNITVAILKKNMKFKKFSIFSIIFTVFIIIIFLFYYLVNNYNSISVYKITGESENFVVLNGLFIVSPEKSYLEIGNIENLNDVGINNLILYYENDDVKHIICESDGEIGLLKNEFNYNELFSYDEIKYIKANLFLEIIFNNDNSNEIIELKLTKDFSNNYLFAKKSDVISDSEDYLELDNNIPKYIKENFKYDAKNGQYYLNVNTDNKKIRHSYYYDADVYIVDEIYEDYMEQFTYYHSSNDLEYTRYESNIEIENFYYNILDKTCISGECNSKLVDYFSSEYLNIIKFK